MRTLQPVCADRGKSAVTPRRAAFGKGFGQQFGKFGSGDGRAMVADGCRRPVGQRWRRHQIDADPQHQHIAFALQQDARQLGARKQHVVRPLKLQQAGIDETRYDVMQRQCGNKAEFGRISLSGPGANEA